MDFSLIIPAFIAGVLTFLAPCTLPLVPGYLGFISGASLADLKDQDKALLARGQILKNAIFYILGFSLVFIVLGSLFGLGGAALIKHRLWLSRLGGIFVIIFGLYLTHLLNLNFLNFDKHFNFAQKLKPGQPTSSFIFGASFAFGWTPCVGPILGAILTLAASSATVLQGAILLTVFSAGLALPFLMVAFGIGSAVKQIKKISQYLNIISTVGGVFLIFIGILLLTDNLSVWISWFFQVFDFINYDKLINFL